MIERIKKQATTLSKELNIPHQKALDLASRLNSYRDYHHATQESKASEKPSKPFQLAEPFQNLEQQLVAISKLEMNKLGSNFQGVYERAIRDRNSLIDHSAEQTKQALEVADTWKNRYEELKESISGDQFYPPSRKNSSTLQN